MQDGRFLGNRAEVQKTRTNVAQRVVSQRRSPTMGLTKNRTELTISWTGKAGWSLWEREGGT